MDHTITPFMNSTTRRQRSWRTSDPDDAAAAVLQRGRQNAIQIRKRRKEEVLRRKRSGLSSQSASTTQEIIDETANKEACRADFNAYIQSAPPSNQGSKDEPIVLLHQRFASTARDPTVRALEQWLLEKSANGRSLILRLITDLQNPATMSMAASILLEITSMQFRDSVKRQTDNYYGPLDIAAQGIPNWCDLFVSKDIDYTCNYLPIIFQRIEDPSTDVAVVESLCNVIGNIVLQQWDSDTVFQSPPSLSFMNELVTPFFWSVLIKKLPLSCYCCACIVRVDTVNLAMDFLRPSTTGSSVNIVEAMAGLLLLENCSAEAAWMVEGLTRREAEAVYVLCFLDGPATSQPSPLLLQLIERIHFHTERLLDFSEASSVNDGKDASKAFLVPALRAIGNIAFSLKSLRRMFQLHPLLLQAIDRLLENASAVMVDGIHSAWNLLVADGCDANECRDVFLPHFLPRLTRILLDEQSRMEWRRESALCIVDVVIDNGRDPTVLLNDFVWNGNPTPSHKEKLIDALVRMIQGPDVDGVLAGMKLLDRLLRSRPESHALFASSNGVDVLDRICSSTQSYDYALQELAANLMDDFFDGTEENESDPIDAAISFNPFSLENAGVPNGTWHSSGTVQPLSPPNGRGRGRVLPSWMSQEQHHSLS